VPVVFAGEGHFRAFVDKNALLFGGEWVVGHEVCLGNKFEDGRVYINLEIAIFKKKSNFQGNGC
jgi:hypothetical protein